MYWPLGSTEDLPKVVCSSAIRCIEPNSTLNIKGQEMVNTHSISENREGKTC